MLDRKSHLPSKYFRTQYLFLGSYLNAKADLKSRHFTQKKVKIFYNHPDDPSEIKPYYSVFERMEKYFSDKIEEAKQKGKNNDISIYQFVNSFESFCNNYRVLLQSPEKTKTRNFPDYYLNHYLESNIPNSTFIKRFEEAINSSLNPFTDPNLIEFLQLLKINYALTGNIKLKRYLEKIGRNFFTKSLLIRKTKSKSEESRKNNPTRYLYRWPNELIYLDQATLIWILEKWKDPESRKWSTKEATDEFHKDNSDNELYKTEDYISDYYRSFRSNILPVYYWFIRFYISDFDKADHNKNLIDTTMLLREINVLIYEIATIFPSSESLLPRNNDDVSQKFGADNKKGLMLEKGSWFYVDQSPKIPF